MNEEKKRVFRMTTSKGVINVVALNFQEALKKTSEHIKDAHEITAVEMIAIIDVE